MSAASEPRSRLRTIGTVPARGTDGSARGFPAARLLDVGVHVLEHGERDLLVPADDEVAVVQERLTGHASPGGERERVRAAVDESVRFLVLWGRLTRRKPPVPGPAPHAL